MDEAEQLCDRLVVMDNGKIVAEGSPRSLIGRFATRDVVELRFSLDMQPAESELEGLAKRIESLPDRTLLYTDNADATLVDLTERSLAIESTIVRRSTLEDVFLRLTGRSLID
jgi:lipooligosaccharide transport system ATP-binding protein